MPKTTISYASNQVCHFDIAGPDMEGLKTFYATVFGWTVESKGPGYSLVQTPVKGIGGAILDSETASLTVGVAVDDLDAAIRSAKRANGSVVMPKTDNGWVTKAQIADPAGNRITLIQR